jgi:hypothetical protein
VEDLAKEETSKKQTASGASTPCLLLDSFFLGLLFDLEDRSYMFLRNVC